LNAGFTTSGWLSEQLSGIDNLFFLRDLMTEIETNWDAVRANLEAIRAHVLHRSGMLVNATLDAANWEQVQPQVAQFISTLPAGTGELATWTPDFNTANEGLTIPVQVNYVGKGGNLYDLGYKADGAAYVVPRWLGTDWLWERVRMMGGAYGAFAGFDSYTGVFSYVSYRDPNLLETLENYDGSAEYLGALDLSDSELTKAIIGTMSDLDAYQLADAKGYSQMVRHFVGMTDALRQQIRDDVLATTAADFQAFGAALAKLNAVGRVVVLGSAEAIEAANAAQPGLLTVTKVL
ncbi:MAG: peptidase M16, partial [Armatimonadetes bacterium]|nr:peptidase M16 [Anaerolineae bacterium]